MAKKKSTARKTTARRAKTVRKSRTTARKPAKAKAGKRAAAKPGAATAASPQVVTPYLCCKGAAAALDFYRDAFGAREKMRITGTDGSIGHAEISIDGSAIMISDEWAEGGVFSPPTLGGTAVSVHLYVKDVDAFARRALAAGAMELRPVQDQPYGDRSGTLRDPFGHRWMIATAKRPMSKAEMESAFAGAYKVT